MSESPSVPQLIFVLAVLNRAGIEHQTLALARALQERHPKIRVRVWALPNLKYDAAMATEFEEVFQKNFVLKVFNTESTLTLLWKRWKFLRTLLSEVPPGARPTLHGDGIVSLILLTLLKLSGHKLNATATIHLNYANILKRGKTIRRLAYTAIYPLLRITGAKLVFVSEESAQGFHSQYFADRSLSQVIANGVDIARLQSIPRQDASTRKELAQRYNLDVQAPWIFSSSRIEAKKGIAESIAVFRELVLSASRASLPLPQLILAGHVEDVKYQAQLNQQIEGAGLCDRVKFLGAIADVPKFLRVADLFIFTSESEAHPLGVLEALAAELPVLCRELPVLRAYAPPLRFFENPTEGAQIAQTLLAPSPNATLTSAQLQEISQSHMVEKYEKLFFPKT